MSKKSTSSQASLCYSYRECCYHNAKCSGTKDPFTQDVTCVICGPIYASIGEEEQEN